MNKKYLLGLYEKAIDPTLGWYDKLLLTKKVGFDFLEISIDETDEKINRLDFSSIAFNEIITAIEKTNVPIKSLCLSAHRKYSLGSESDEIANKGVSLLKKAVEFAAKVGIPIIMLAGYDVFYETSSDETIKRFSGNLEQCVDFASRQGIILAFETMETPFMNTVEKAMIYVNKINSPFLQVYPDIGNITNSCKIAHISVSADISKGRGHLVGLHLKETQPNIYRNMIFGQGHVNFQEAIDTAWNLGIRRYVTEFWYQDKMTWEKNLLFSFNFINSILLQKTTI